MDNLKQPQDEKLALVSVFPDDATEQEKLQSPVLAEQLKEALINGLDVVINNSIIKGEVFVDSQTISGRVQIIDSVFTDYVHFNYSSFKSCLRLYGTQFFDDASFKSVHFSPDMLCDYCRFNGLADFSGAKFFGSGFFDNATFSGKSQFTCAKLEGDVQFRNAIFHEETSFNSVSCDGNADFSGVTANKSFDMVNFTVGSALDFSNTKFNGFAAFSKSEINGLAHFNNSVFKDESTFNLTQFYGGARFHECVFNNNIDFSGCLFRFGEFFNTQFDREVNFAFVSVGINLDFGDSYFGDSIDMTYLKVEGPLLLCNTEFTSDFSLNQAEINGFLNIDQANFAGLLNLTSAHIGVGIQANNVRFLEEVEAIGLYVGESVVIDNSHFTALVDFNRSEIRGSFFARDCVFKDSAFFGAIYVKGQVNIEGSQFFALDFMRSNLNGGLIANQILVTNTANFSKLVTQGNVEFLKANFEGELFIANSNIGNYGIFNSGIFKQRATFSGTIFQNTAIFDEAIFCKNAEFDTCVFSQPFRFSKVICHSKASFIGLNAKSLAFFSQTEITDKLDLENAKFNIINFSDQDEHEKDTQLRLNSEIRLKGFSCVDFFPHLYWETLAEKLDVFDKQPLVFFENLFNNNGHTDVADNVYYTRRRMESKLIDIRVFGKWLIDRFLWLATGYGVKLPRLLYIMIPLLLFGTLVFKYVDHSLTQNQTPSTTQIQSNPKPRSLTDAFLISLNMFIPVVDLPIGGSWQPSNEYRLFCILVLILPGWILVPIAVAGLTGMLKR